jgi:hypothetical protein
MRFRLPLLTLAAGALALPAGASAAATWSAPATIPGAGGAPARSVFTLAGHGLVLSGVANAAGGPSQLASITADGAVTSRRPLSFVASELATYGKDRIVVAGRTLATSGPTAGTIDDTSVVVTRFGTPADLGAQRTVPGTKGRQLYALASNADGLTAIVTGGAGSRVVHVRRPGSSRFVTKLRIKVSGRARDATVAIGEDGDLLVVYEDAHEIRARHIGRRGGVGPVHRLGAGVQSDLQATVSANGRMNVAWKTQRVHEGSAGTPAIVWLATAAPGHRFGTARRIATVGAAAAGRYVAPPGVRLLDAGDDAQLLAYTGFDGTRYTVEARHVTDGRLGPARRLSPAGVDAVLGDAAVGPNGAQVVTWRAGVAGADPALLPGGTPAPTPVLASVRSAGATVFGAAEAVSPADASVFYPPTTAIDPVSGGAIVAYGTFTPATAVQLAARPAA